MSISNTANAALTSSPPRILLADDEAVLRHTIALTLEREGFEVVGQAATGEEAIRLARHLKPDVLLLDVNMPAGDGLRVLAVLKPELNETAFAVLSAYISPAQLAGLMLLGVEGIFSKDISAAALRQALLELLDRHKEGSPSPMMASEEWLKATWKERDEGAPVVDRLTAQEARVLALVAAGLSNQEMASVLSISLNTVKSHLRRIYAKLGVSGRTQAALRFLEQSEPDSET